MSIELSADTVIAHGAKLLRAGKLVVFPTETVYGLGADATNDAAVADIFSLKGRPQFNPLIVHVSGVSMAMRLVMWNETAEKLASAFWPGPLTLVLNRLPASPISLLASAGEATLGVRMPAHKTAQALLLAADIPVAAPSANRSGRVSPTTAQHVAEELGGEDLLIIDGGACDVGIESTVIDLTSEVPALLRPGSIERVQIEEVLGQKIMTHLEQQGALKSPGLLASHYAPSLPVRLNVTKPHSDEALLAFGGYVPEGAMVTFNLSTKGELKEAAAHLFAALRTHDKPHYAGIAVMPIPEEGIGIAINDRLRRAATRT